MRQLPKWRLTNPFPAFYDTESGSAIEQTAKVYKAVQDLIDEYNTFSEGVSESLAEHETETAEKIQQLELEFSQKFQDFIDTVELMLNDYALESDAINNLQRQIDGLEIEKVYDESTESMSYRLKKVGVTNG